jgi:hypothetical protein
MMLLRTAMTMLRKNHHAAAQISSYSFTVALELLRSGTTSAT